MSIRRRYVSPRSPEELMKRAEGRVDRASVFLAGPGDRDILGHLSPDRMRFRCRPGFLRSFAEPVLAARMDRHPEGGTRVEARVGMRRPAFWFMVAWGTAAGLMLPIALCLGEWPAAAFASGGLSMMAGCVLLERRKVARLLRLADEIFSGG